MSESAEIYRTGRDALTEDEVRLLLKHTKIFRDRTLLSLAISTGIRREDLVAIRMEGVDTETGVVSFHESKKGRTWRAVVSGEALEWLRMYVNSLPR